MSALLTETRRVQSPAGAHSIGGHDPAGAPTRSVGHRLIAHAREALAAGDELVAVLMLRMAYEAFDKRERSNAA